MKLRELIREMAASSGGGAPGAPGGPPSGDPAPSTPVAASTGKIGSAPPGGGQGLSGQGTLKSVGVFIGHETVEQKHDYTAKSVVGKGIEWTKPTGTVSSDEKVHKETELETPGEHHSVGHDSEGVTEDATAGATASGDIATVAYPLFVRGRSKKDKRKNARAAVGQKYIPGPLGIGQGVFEGNQIRTFTTWIYNKGDKLTHGMLGAVTVEKSEGDSVFVRAHNDNRVYRVSPHTLKSNTKEAHTNELNELSNTDQESYYRFLVAKVKTGRTLSKQEKEFIKTYQFYKMSVAEGSLNEFAPGDGEDGPEDDPYKYPKPESYRRSADFFGKFEADHFDREDFDDATGVFKGYWGKTQIAYFKFNDPTRTGSDDPGMGWYYEPESAGSAGATAAPAVDNSAQRKQQELGMIDAFLKSGQTPKPGTQIYSLMKRHGMAEAHVLNHDNVIYRLDRDNPMSDTEVLVLGGAGRYSLKALRDKARREAAALAQDLSIEHGGAFRRSATNIKQLTNTINTIVAAYNELARLRRKGGRGSRGITDEDANFIRECIRVVEQAAQNYRLMENLKIGNSQYKGTKK